MTKEEAIKVLSESIHDGSKVPWDKIVEAVHLSIEALSQPSLPSNLDEAAKDSWAVYEYRESPKGLYSTCYVDGFKAGAEWMARRGSSFKVNVEEVPQGHWYAGLHLGGCAAEEENALKSINAKDGEEVIVQIRKK